MSPVRTSLDTGTTFGQLLARVRRRSGLTQAELAERAGLSPRTISDIERGVRTKTYASTVRMILDSLALDPDEAAMLAASVDRSRKQRVVPSAVSELELTGTGSEKLVRLLTSLGEAVIATDLRGVVLFWNTQATQLYGYSEVEAVGRSVYDLTVPDTAVSSARDIMHTLSSGLIWTGEFNVRDKSGRTFAVRVTDVPVVGPNGDLQLIIGFSTKVAATG